MNKVRNFINALKRLLKSNNVYDRWSRLTRKTQKIVAVFVFALTGLAVTFVINAADLAREETVVLANGVEVRLGDPVDEVVKKLGSSSLATKDKKIIQYPKPTQERPVEVLIYTDGKMVVAVNIINNTRNKIKTTPVNIEADKEDLVGRYRQGAKRRALENIGDNDYKLSLNRSAAYYEFDACSDSSKVQSVTLAYTSAENLFGAHTKPNCEVVVD